MLFKRKEIWVPTWKGWLLFVAIAVACAFAVMRFTAPFLATTKPINAPVLVIEGWISDVGVERAIALDETNHYALVVTAGQHIERGLDVSHYGTYADLCAARLVNLGFKGTNIVKVPSGHTRKDRTYHSAVAVRNYLLTNTPHRQIDVLSDSVHARRSWLLFQKACEPEIKVGIIANEHPGFDPKNWWKSSNGVRIVMSEAISYLYARIFFSPDR